MKFIISALFIKKVMCSDSNGLHRSVAKAANLEGTEEECVREA
jgi:hypothetical protein